MQYPTLKNLKPKSKLIANNFDNYFVASEQHSCIRHFHFFTGETKNWFSRFSEMLHCSFNQIWFLMIWQILWYNYLCHRYAGSAVFKGNVHIHECDSDFSQLTTVYMLHTRVLLQKMVICMLDTRLWPTNLNKEYSKKFSVMIRKKHIAVIIWIFNRC